MEAQAAREMPFVVEFEERPMGMGPILLEMYQHCQDKVPAGDWFGIGARFYFRREADRSAFKQRFSGVPTAA